MACLVTGLKSMKNSRKPSTRTAMLRLISQIRAEIPFDMPEATLCRGPCTGCSKKLMEFLDQELVSQQQDIDLGEVPTLGQIHKLARLAKKVHKVLVKNGLIDGPTTNAEPAPSPA